MLNYISWNHIIVWHSFEGFVKILNKGVSAIQLTF